MVFVKPSSVSGCAENRGCGAGSFKDSRLRSRKCRSSDLLASSLKTLAGGSTDAFLSQASSAADCSGCSALSMTSEYLKH